MLSFERNMEILITGSTGFIGYHLINRLIEKGHSLTCLVRNSSNLRRLKEFSLNYIHLDDIKNGNFNNRKFDVLYHLASIRHKWGTSWSDYCESGQNYTKMLLKMSPNRISHFVFCSSVAVYGYPDNLPISEDTPKKPMNLYGKMKLECEKLVKNFSGKNNIPFTIINNIKYINPKFLRGI